MNQQPRPEEPEGTWQQPPFAPTPSASSHDPNYYGRPAAETYQQPTGAGYQQSDPFAQPTVTGEVLANGGSGPASSRRIPPSVLESVLRVLSGVLFPLALVLAIFGFGGFLVNIVVAMVAAALMRQVAGEMARRRRLGGSRDTSGEPR